MNGDVRKVMVLEEIQVDQTLLELEEREAPDPNDKRDWLPD